MHSEGIWRKLLLQISILHNVCVLYNNFDENLFGKKSGVWKICGEKSGVWYSNRVPGTKNVYSLINDLSCVDSNTNSKISLIIKRYFINKPPDNFLDSTNWLEGINFRVDLFSRFAFSNISRGFIFALSIFCLFLSI